MLLKTEQLKRGDAVQPRQPVVEVIDAKMVEVLRNKTPQERLEIAFGMWDFAAEMIQANLRRENAGWTDAEVQRETARRMRGKND